MLGPTIAFLTGVVFPIYWPQLPPRWIYHALLLLNSILVLYYQYKKKHWLKLIICFLIGILLCLYRAMAVTTALPEHYFNRSIVATGTIASIPDHKRDRVQFEYLIDTINGKERIQPTRILATQYTYGTQSAIPIQLGERWHLILRLKQPRGFWNPGSFDYQAWLLQKGISATGILVQSRNKATKQHALSVQPLKLVHCTFYQPLNAMTLLLMQWRSRVHIEINNAIPSSPVKNLLSTLIIGMREEVTDDQWAIMRATGTNHLFAISGLHIGFIGGLLYVVVNFIWRRVGQFTLYLPAKQMAYVASWIGACGYSLLSGFALPVQRAIIMMTVFIIALLKKRILTPWLGWCIALCIILISHPFVVLSESFWLSFGAVAVIFYGLGGQLSLKHQLSSSDRLWQQWGRTQWIVTIGLFPLTALFFNQITLIGFIANLIAIPWVGFLVLPMSLLGGLVTLFWPSAGSLLLQAGALILHSLWQFLAYIALLPGANTFFHIPNLWILSSTSLGVGLYLSPTGFPGRYYLSMVWLLPIFLYQTPSPSLPGHYWLTLLDVGQGLAAVVRTQHHVLIYDTGPRLSENLNAGNAVLIPYLKQFNIKKIDRLVISHGDNDHSGGAKSLMKEICTKEAISSQPYRIHQSIQFCQSGQQWKWDDVTFRILHPPKGHGFKANDSSCVLQIDNGIHRVLLPGDIQRKAERHLVKQYSTLASTIVIAPHHGSKTSSSPVFVNATNARYVLLPVGYRNRFKFPHAQVIDRYKRNNSQIYSTAKKGAITIQLGKGYDEVVVKTHYDTGHRFWHNRIHDTA